MATVSPDPGFSTDELLTQAQGNVTGFSLALVRYAREHGESPESVARWLGSLFAPGWEQLRGQGAQPVARTVALNLVSGGAILQGLTGDVVVEVTLSGLFDAETLEFFELTQGEADHLLDVFVPIAAHAGIGYRWERQGESVMLTFTPEEGER